MKIGRRFEFPEEQQRLRARARRLEWLSIALLTSASVVMGFAVGGSEAMKTAWIGDILSVIPPITVLIAMRVEERPPTRRFPYGYFRAISIAFLATAVVLFLVGFSLFYDAAMKLLLRQHPTIGTAELFGRQFWAGWEMVAALTYSMSVGMLLGHLKRPVSEKMHNKVLHADADTNRADWMSEGAGIVGILLVGFGLWWGDAGAAVFISLGIMYDGWHSLREVLGDLMDESPTKLGGKDLEKLPTKLKEAAEAMPWVREAAVRLREQGHVLSGDVFIVPRDERDLVARVERAAEDLTKLDWRLYNLTVMPVAELDGTSPPET